MSDGASLPVSPIRTYEPGWERPGPSPLQPTDIYHSGSGRCGVDMGSLGALERSEAGARRHTPPRGGRAAPGLEARAQSPWGGGDRAAEQPARFTLDSPPPVRAASGQASRGLGEAADGGAGARSRDLWGNGEALRGSGGKAVFVRGRRGAGHL